MCLRLQTIFLLWILPPARLFWGCHVPWERLSPFIHVTKEIIKPIDLAAAYTEAGTPFSVTPAHLCHATYSYIRPVHVWAQRQTTVGRATLWLHGFTTWVMVSWSGPSWKWGFKLQRLVPQCAPGLHGGRRVNRMLKKLNSILQTDAKLPPPLNRKSADGAHGGGDRNEHGVSPPVNATLHIHPILACIFIVRHVFVCVCLCVRDEASECVDLRALQGCEARRSKRQKIPRCRWISVSKQEAEHHATCALS